MKVDQGAYLVAATEFVTARSWDVAHDSAYARDEGQDISFFSGLRHVILIAFVALDQLLEDSLVDGKQAVDDALFLDFLDPELYTVACSMLK